jgi:hypothetical protein
MNLLPRALSLLLVVTSLNAATYYVDSVAGNDRNDGLSTARAWKSLDKVCSESRNKKVRKNGFAAGDQILFRRGQTFQSTGYPILTVAGTSTAPVTVGAWGVGEAPRFDNQGTGIYDIVLKVDGISALVQGLAFVKGDAANVTEHGIYLAGRGHRLTQCDISGVGIGAKIEGEDHRVDNCAFHDLTMVIADSYSDNDYGAIGVVLSGVTRASVDHNTFTRLRAASPDYGFDGSAVEFFNASSAVQVFNNRVQEVAAFTEMGGNTADAAITDVVYHHNVVTEADAIGYFHNLAGTTYGIAISGVAFDHNTFVKRSTRLPSWLFGFGQPLAAGTFFFRNNIVVHENSSGLFYQSGQLVHSANLYSLVNTSWGDAAFQLDSTEILADPAFVDLAGGDYRLQATSPAVDSGLSLGYTTDAADLPAPLGAAPDRGAFESR